MWPFKKNKKHEDNLNMEDRCGYTMTITPDLISNCTTYQYSYSQRMQDISSFVILYSTITKNLLEKKGFPINNSMSLIQERIALLHSEVSELVDAEKKGKSIKDKQDELADIIIRLMNIPLMFNDILDEFKKYSESEKHKQIISSISICKDIKLHEFYDMMKEYENAESQLCKELKLTVANKIHRSIVELEGHLINLKESRFFEDSLFFSINNILNIILYCYLYVELSPEIGGNLHEFIDSKMKENFKRPYKFNTSSNF